MKEIRICIRLPKMMRIRTCIIVKSGIRIRIKFKSGDVDCGGSKWSHGGSRKVESGKRDPHPVLSGSGFVTLLKYRTQLRDDFKNLQST